MQILFEEERASLTEQHKRDERALADMDERLQLIRRREQELKEEYNLVMLFTVHYNLIIFLFIILVLYLF